MGGRVIVDDPVVAYRNVELGEVAHTALVATTDGVGGYVVTTEAHALSHSLDSLLWRREPEVEQRDEVTAFVGTVDKFLVCTCGYRGLEGEIRTLLLQVVDAAEH